MHTFSSISTLSLLNCSSLGITQGFTPDLLDAVYTITRPKNWSILDISCTQYSPSILSFKELVPKILSYPTIETFIDKLHSILKKLPIEDLGVRKFMVLELALLKEVMTWCDVMKVEWDPGQGFRKAKIAFQAYSWNHRVDLSQKSDY